MLLLSVMLSGCGSAAAIATDVQDAAQVSDLSGDPGDLAGSQRDPGPTPDDLAGADLFQQAPPGADMYQCRQPAAACTTNYDCCVMSPGIGVTNPGAFCSQGACCQMYFSYGGPCPAGHFRTCSKCDAGPASCDMTCY